MKALFRSLLVALAVLATTVGLMYLLQPAGGPAEADVRWVAVQPGYDGPPGQPNWPLLERCWVDIHLSHAERQAEIRRRWGSIQGKVDDCGTNLTLWCHWQAGYPSRWWVEQACPPIRTWGDDFGSGWSNGTRTNPEAREWVARLRAGGQP